MKMLYLPVILAISLLVIIHEFGHYLVARAFGMRVITYSIGFGPVLFRWRPKGSETVFQVAAIPLLAYVQIAGMNPREQVDPNDRGSYQNASTLARFLTIAAGPLANYLAAMLILLGLLLFGGLAVSSGGTQIGEVVPGSPAATAGFRAGDTFVRVDGAAITRWQDLIQHTQETRGAPVQMVVRRDGRERTLTVTPRRDPNLRRYTIGVVPRPRYVPVPVGDALRAAVLKPAADTVEQVQALARMVRGREKLQVMGPVGIVYETARQAEQGWRHGVNVMYVISLALFFFNLLPVPALDGGRLVFLLYEIILRRRPSPTFEARATAISMVLLLGLSAVVIVRDIAHIATRAT